MGQATNVAYDLRDVTLEPDPPSSPPPVLGYRPPDEDAPRSQPAPRAHTLLAFVGFAVYASLFSLFLIASWYVGGRRRSMEGLICIVVPMLLLGARVALLLIEIFRDIE